MSAESEAPAFVMPPDLRPATFDDFPAIYRLESEMVQHKFTTDDRRGLFENNPLWPRLAPTWPVGWVFEDDHGEIVGTVTNVPSAYRFRGEEKICANGIAWAVADEHRGYAVMLMDEFFRQPGADLEVSSGVASDATAVWRAYGTPVPLGDWQRGAYLVTDRRAFARSTLARRGVPLAGALAGPAAAALAVTEGRSASAGPPIPDDVEIAETQAFDERFDAFWDELLAQSHDVLLAVRDRATLAWHYQVPLRDGGLWIYTATRGGRMRAYCVVKEHVRPDRMRTMRLIDYQTLDPSVDLLPGLVRAAAARCAAERIALLEHSGCDVPRMRGFDQLAPRRSVKDEWAYWFHASDTDLTAALGDPTVWDPSEYDGDASFM